ncbi:hypothetical protein GOV03_03750 [Candidatus Woesearchaeota archaeon]|nr:hypothetical protein [Candidatus Woesearchaeota archaeon]
MVRDLTGKHPGYFEAILQLRDCTEEVREFAEGEIIRDEIRVSKVIELKNGVDFYLSDNNFARKLGKKLREKFGGEIQTTASLWGMRKGREVYRVTVLFRGLHFKKGDMVIYEGEEYKVKLMSKDIFLQNVKTGKKVHVRYKKMDQVKKKE